MTLPEVEATPPIEPKMATKVVPDAPTKTGSFQTLLEEDRTQVQALEAHPINGLKSASASALLLWKSSQEVQDSHTTAPHDQVFCANGHMASKTPLQTLLLLDSEPDSMKELRTSSPSIKQNSKAHFSFSPTGDSVSVSLLDKYSNLQSDREATIKQIQAAEWALEETKARIQEIIQRRRDMQDEIRTTEQTTTNSQALLGQLSHDWDQAQSLRMQAQQKLEVAKMQLAQTKDAADKARIDFVNSVQQLQRKCEEHWLGHIQKTTNSTDTAPSSEEEQTVQAKTVSESIVDDKQEMQQAQDGEGGESKTEGKSSTSSVVRSLIELCEADEDEDDDFHTLTTVFKKNISNVEADEDASNVLDLVDTETPLKDDERKLLKLKEDCVPLLAFALVDERHGYSKLVERLATEATDNDTLARTEDESKGRESEGTTESTSRTPLTERGSPTDWIQMLQDRLEEDSQEEIVFKETVSKFQERIRTAQRLYDKEQSLTLETTKHHETCFEKRTQQNAQIKQLESQLSRMLRDVDSLEAELQQVQSDIYELDNPESNNAVSDGVESESDSEASTGKGHDKPTTAMNGPQHRPRQDIAQVVDKRVRQAVLPAASSSTIPSSMRKATRIKNPYLRKDRAKPTRSADIPVQRVSAITPGSSAKKKRSKKKRKRLSVDDESISESTQKSGNGGNRSPSSRSRVSPYFGEASKKVSKPNIAQQASIPAPTGIINTPVSSQGNVEVQREDKRGWRRSAFGTDRQYPHRVGKVRPCKAFGLSLSLHNMPMEMKLPSEHATRHQTPIAAQASAPKKDNHFVPPPAPSKKGRATISEVILHNCLLDDDSSSSSSSSPATECSA